MENRNRKDPDQSKVVDEKRKTLLHLKERYDFEKEHFGKQTEFFENFTSHYDFNQEKRNSSNEQAFLRIKNGLNVLDGNLKTTGSNLSLLEKAIQSMETIVGATNERETNMFMDYAMRVSKPVEEMNGKTMQNLEIIRVLSKELKALK